MANNEKMNRQQKLAVMPMKKLVFSLALPMMISFLVQALYNIVDSIFLSRLNELALSAASLASPIQMLMIAVSVGTGVGINSLTSRTLGSGNNDEASEIATTGLILAVLSSFIFLLFGAFGSGTYLSLFTDDPELHSLSKIYLTICTSFSLGIFVATTAERLLQSTGNAFLSMIAQVTGALVNCILDPIFIFGYWGVPEMGIAGAAIATVVGQWFAAAIALILNFRLNHDITFRFHKFHLKKEIITDIYHVGIPSMLVSGLGSIQMMLLNKAMLGFSATAVAFYGIYHKIQTFTSMPLNGLGQSTIPIIGYSYGAKRGKRIMEAFSIIMKTGIIISVVFTLILELVPEKMLGIFNASEGMLSIGVPGIRIMSLGLVFMSATSFIGYTFTGMGNGFINMCSTLMRLLIPICIILIFMSSEKIDVIWIAILAGEVLAFVFSMWKFRKGYREMIRPIL